MMNDTNVKDKTAMAVSLALPDTLNMTRDPGPIDAARQQEIHKREKQVKAVMFLDKLENEKLIRDLQPIAEKQIKDRASLYKKLSRMSDKLVGALKVDEIFDTARKALAALGIHATKCGVSLKTINHDERVLEVERFIGEKTGYTQLTSGEVDVPFTDEMNTIQDALDALDKAIKATEKQRVEAQANLQNRANRMSDAEGALAIKTSSETELQEIQEAYRGFKDGFNGTKQIGSGN